MRLPIRARLTAWYAALLAAILVALGAFVVLQLRSDLMADADARLDATAQQLALAYRREGVKDFRDIGASVLGPDDGAALVGPGGAVVASRGRGGLPAAPGRHTAEIEGTRYRVLAWSVEHRGERVTLVTAESLAAEDRAADRVLTLLAVGGLAALALTAAGGWWLARQALRPVERMTAEAARIGADDLDRRLDLPRADDEVARLGRTLNAMLDRVERGVADKRRLIADASHELRGPLAVMRAELDVALADPDLDPTARGALESTREEADRLARMVDDMLTLAQADEGRLELFTETVDLRKLAERFTQNVEGDGVAGADRLRLEHAVSNLVDNAVKYGAEPIAIEVWDGGLAVTDGGPGVPPGERERIFERFVRLDAARGRGGSGLGLAICAEVARAHGGRAYVEPADGDGARFVLSLDQTSRSQAKPVSPAASTRSRNSPVT